MGIQKIHHLKSRGSSSQSHIPGSLKCEAKGMEDHPVFGADSGDDLDDCDLKEISCELGMVEVPNDGCLLNEDVHADAIRCNLPKKMKTLESVRAKNIVASPSTNGMNIIAPNYSTKGVVKVKTYGNANHNHNQKIVLGDISEQCRTVPKGLLKVVQKGPSVQPELPKVFSNRSQTASLVGAQDLQDCKVSYSPASLYLGNAGGFSGTPFMWQKVSGSKLNLEQSQCALSRQHGTFRSSRYLQSSGEDISKEVDIADLDKHKLFGHGEESVTGSKRYNFGGQSLWQNFDMGKKKLFERSLELYPFADQFHEGEKHSRIMQRECITIFPRVPEAVSRNSGIGGGLQEKLMAFPNQMKSPCDYSVGNSENSSKPSVSERLKYDLTLPLTYKRRKPQAKSSSEFAHSLMKDTEIRDGSPKESKRLSGENLKALRVKFMGWETPMSKICEALNRCGKKAEALAESVWNHLRVSPSIADAAVARLAQGTKVLAEGGHDKLFQHTFQTLAGEKLLHAYVCYLSTSSGPVIGTLYISSKRIAFSSDYPLRYTSSPGHQQWMYYKVVVELDKLATVDPSANRLNPSEKYIHIVTTDGYEFWLMGFISYDKALKSLNEALRHSRHESSIPVL
ncbi:FH interacting protein 1 [Corchorus capsularis]|uniref:FH interacting protein 1 n=1 Tax=Corchorus capsularis TaxID=210143 RepID=A0A1R3H1A2_COCAP|nr:FH interacting protein 1 [Corchorus capsularis]